VGNNDWQRIEELFHNALGLPAEERVAYLRQAAAEDPEVRAEVESLLAVHDRDPGFMEHPVLSRGLKILSQGAAEETLTGKQIGSYRILRLLGKGGMGEVYLAEDVRLGRNVALKFLSSQFVDDAWAKRQLIKEAQAVARLDHPNICGVHGFEEADGFSFMVLQYIEGETLGAMIRKGALEGKQIVDLATQIVKALADAHSHGIIHRDIKPQNIMVGASGQVKVLDFGLAKLLQQKGDALSAADNDSQSSQLGLVIGTVAYMSPEQLRAERLDFRTDVFSFGVVLYEILGGRNPFARPSNAEVISAILTADPPPLALSPGIPQDLARIAHKCMSKSREERHQSASALLLEFTASKLVVGPDKSTKHRAVSPHRRRQLQFTAYLSLSLFVLLGSGGALLYSRLTRVPSLAVLPILNETGNAEMAYLSEGLTESVANTLSHLPRVRVKAPRVRQGQIVSASQAGRDLNVDAVIVGTLARKDGSLVLTTKLVNTVDGAELWDAEQEVRPDDMLPIERRLRTEIAAALQLNLTAGQLADGAHQTHDPEAFSLYMRGRHFWSLRDKENLPRAIGLFQQAIDRDPDYARAYAGLADCYVLSQSVGYGPAPPKQSLWEARQHARKALEEDNTLCEAHTSLAIVGMNYDWTLPEAEREFKQAISLNPDYAQAHFSYSMLLALLRRWDESITEAEVAKRLDPYSPHSDLNMARVCYYARSFEKAAEYARRLLDADQENVRALYILGLVYQQQGRSTEAIDLFERVYSIDKLLGAATLGYVYGKAGRTADAQGVLEVLEGLSKQAIVPPQEKAIIYLGLGDRDRAFALLQQACTDHFGPLAFVRVEPVFDGIRSDARYLDLARCMDIAP